LAPPPRREALATLREGQDRLTELFGRLSDDAMTRPATIGGGDWSVKDLMGHVAAWEELALISLDEWRRHEMPWVERPEGPMSGTDQVDAYNARVVEEKGARDLRTIRRGAEASHQQLVAAIEAMADEEWLATAPYSTQVSRIRTLADLLGTLTAAPKRPFGHAFAHLPDLEAYVRSLDAG
jgi:hypothetical protein